MRIALSLFYILMKVCGILLFWLITMWACNNHVPKNEAIPASRTVIQQQNNSQQEEVFICPRGQATPVLQKEDYPNATFVLEADSISAIETTELPNGDKLTVRTWGCEYLVYTFKFETRQFSADTADLSYWYAAAEKLMTGMLGGTNVTLDLKKGVMFLSYYAVKNHNNLKLGEEIDFGEPDSYRNFVTLDRIQTLSNGNNMVTVSFAEGPL